MPDRDNVIKRFADYFYHFKAYCIGDIEDHAMLKDVLELLKEQPEIVRCKDCMHFDGCDCKVNDIVNIMDTEWFCADGQPR